MNRRLACLFLISAGLLLAPFRSPAPLIYTPGEGWLFEPVGNEGKWRRANAKDQLVVAQDAFDNKKYDLALKAARRLVKEWPLSDYTAQAQYLIGRCYEAKSWDEKAFKGYQALMEKYPKSVNYEEVLQRQIAIADRFLAGQWFRVLNYIPTPPSMERTVGLYEKIVKNGPYSEVGQQAQLKIGTAREKQSKFPEAVKAYEQAADRYSDHPKVASEALFREAWAFRKQALKADYDQSTAGQAIALFTDFMTLYPDDPRSEEARKIILELKTEQARGCFENARFYERNHKWMGAKTYYNEVVNLLLGEENSPLAVKARERIAELNKLIHADNP
jgi:outer membrane protein assembly factor BamD (BamD/ComL family)